ncbi:MAG TPA: XdhC family protein [Chitinophagaceae bacterium]|nr:XdhC family protein [Chitinophagaceae bacterium]
MKKKEKSITKNSQSPPSGSRSLPGSGGGGPVWKFINDKLSANIDVMLLYVLDSEGSSPGRRGFKMAVSADGEMCGTIGGGIMEFKLVEKARSILQSGIRDISVARQFHDKQHAKDQSGMICSGSQLNLLMPLTASGAKKTIEKIVEAQKKNEKRAIHLSPAGIRVTDDPANQFTYQTETDWNYIETIDQRPVIHIIGGGHVALALSELMHYLGFYIKLYDDRTELNTIEQNSFADEKHFVDYGSIGENIHAAEDDFVVIMTIGYRTDRIVLKQLLHKKFYYLGLLGSEKKNEKLLTELKQEGAGEHELTKVFAPIGLNIYSKTTREIAVSIAAQIILEKNKDLPTGRARV